MVTNPSSAVRYLGNRWNSEGSLSHMRVFKDTFTDVGQSKKYKCKGKKETPCYVSVLKRFLLDLSKIKNEISRIRNKILLMK